ncbi:MAG TPA: hypothetical protein VFP35_02525 [Candidatus Saccharimonadales bacterium]|nr:hypothetical protein [Candidatus Saccharimonadales bacterium]
MKSESGISCRTHCPVLKKGLKRQAQLERTLESVNSLALGSADRENETYKQYDMLYLVDELGAILEPALETAKQMGPAKAHEYISQFFGLQKCRGQLLDLNDRVLQEDPAGEIDRQALSQEMDDAITIVLQELSLFGKEVELPSRPSFREMREQMIATGDAVQEDLAANEARITELEEACETGPVAYRRLKIGPIAYACGSCALRSAGTRAWEL